MTKTGKITYFLVALIFFIICDLYFSNLLINADVKVYENSLFDLVNVSNTGAAFSLLENYPFLLVLFAVFAILMIVIYGVLNIEKFSAVACFWAALLTSGISCNLYERIIYGHVRDFINLKFIDFPVFNISDIFITVSVIALIILIIKNKYLKK